MVAMDKDVQTYEQFVEALGSGREKTDLAESVAYKLAQKLNKECNVFWE
jgi:hypothetical protein